MTMTSTMIVSQNQCLVSKNNKNIKDMYLIDYFRNYINALVGRNQEFEELLAAGDIDAVKQKMVHRQTLIEEAMRDYDVKQ